MLWHSVCNRSIELPHANNFNRPPVVLKSKNIDWFRGSDWGDLVAVFYYREFGNCYLFLCLFCIVSGVEYLKSLDS